MNIWIDGVYQKPLVKSPKWIEHGHIHMINNIINQNKLKTLIIHFKAKLNKRIVNSINWKFIKKYSIIICSLHIIMYYNAMVPNLISELNEVSINRKLPWNPAAFINAIWTCKLESHTWWQLLAVSLYLQ